MIDIKDIEVDVMPDIVTLKISVNARYNKEIAKIYNDFKLSGKPYQLEIKKKTAKRSLNANAYAWVLCQKIAEVVGTTKEAVYKKNIEEVGAFEILPMMEAAAQRFIATWQNNGLGWIADVMGSCHKEGYVNVIAYYGSSTYNTREMSRLIESLVLEAKELGIETMDEEKLEQLLQSMGK